MRKSLLFLLNTLLAAATLCVVSCGIDDVDAEDGAIQFELYDTEGTLIEGLQSMKFGATTAYTLKSAFVTYTEVTAPAGWKCSVIPSSRSCTVTAPVASDLEAEAGGDITIAITSQAGRTMSYTLSVAALEESISLTFDGDATTKNHIFSYGKSLVFPFSCENTSSLEVEAPEGWTTETDLENNQLTVTAPMPDSQNPTLTGAVKVTPLSVRGTAGESSSISVELSTKMPVIQFAEPIDRFVFGEQRDIPCTMQYVDKCDITAPEGWTVELDIAASMLKVTAPAEGVGIPAGTVTLDAVSAEELTESFETQLSLKGIATGDDFVAFGKAVTEAARQVRLRNLGGLVIIDTIDMKSRKDRQAVYKRLKDEMEKDKAKSQVLPISQLGIMQMTRQRHAQSNSSGIYVACPYCGGKGIVKSARTMSGEIQRKIVATCRNLRESAGAQKEIGLLIMLHPENLQRLQNEDYEYLLNLEKQYNVKLTFRADPSYHVENFRVVPSEK